MKRFNVLLSMIFFIFFASNAFAELKIIKQESVDVIPGSNQKLVLDDGRIYWVKPRITSSSGSEPDYLELEGFFDDTPVGRVGINHAPIFFPRGDSNSLIFLGDANADWLAIKPNKQLTGIDKKTELKSFLGVTGSTRVKGGYVVAGLIKDKALIESRENEETSYRPILAKLDESLRLVRELKFPDEGEINSIFAQSGKVYATLSYEKKPPEMLELSSELSILKRHSIPIGFATGIPLRDGGFAITYMVIPTMDIMIERRDAKFRLLWKKKLFTEKGISSVLYSLCELQDGLGLVGQVDNRLVVARIGMDGQSLRITKGPENGLYFDPFKMFLLGVRGNDIHIRGIGRNSVSRDRQSFHYVETP